LIMGSCKDLCGSPPGTALGKGSWLTHRRDFTLVQDFERGESNVPPCNCALVVAAQLCALRLLTQEGVCTWTTLTDHIVGDPMDLRRLIHAAPKSTEKAKRISDASEVLQHRLHRHPRRHINAGVVNQGLWTCRKITLEVIHFGPWNTHVEQGT